MGTVYTIIPRGLQMYKVRDIELELSTYCNADCPLCYRNYNSFDEHYPDKFHRPLQSIREQILRYPDLEWIRLVGSISEPTMYNKFLELVDFIKSRNIKIELCTNGSTRDVFWWRSLSKKLTKEDSVYFTICGSTQELHETYRVGTSLDKILKNANAYRISSDNNNDYAQCIRFDYNDNDFNSDEFKEMVSDFTNVYMTETFLLKDSSNYVNKYNLNKLKPYPGKIEAYETVEKIANLKFNKGLSKVATCKAYNENRLQIDVNGNEYPCYLTLEAQIDPYWTWEEILSMKYNACKFCEKSIVTLCDEKDLDFII